MKKLSNYLKLTLMSVLAFTILHSCGKSEFETVEAPNTKSEVKTRAPSMRRSPTPSEKADLLSSFPSLDVDNITITGEPTWQYNCIAYSMGITNNWINPNASLASFQNQYIDAESLYGASCNYNVTSTESSNADVDGWGNYSEMTHGSILYGWRTWESKLGASLRITHGRSELTGDLYGSIKTSFVTNWSRDLSEQASQSDIQLSTIEVDAVTKAVKKVKASTVNNFNKLFEEWTEEIKSNSLTKYSSNTRDYAKLPQFEQMKAMGTEIIPLILEKMLNEKHFAILVLYDTIQNNDKMKISYKNGDIEILEGEQNRARRTIRIWLKNQN